MRPAETPFSMQLLKIQEPCPPFHVVTLHRLLKTIAKLRQWGPVLSRLLPFEHWVGFALTQYNGFSDLFIHSCYCAKCKNIES